MEYEETLALISPCFVYRIPPRTTTTGYKAEEWNLEKPEWTGRAKVKSVGELCFVQLEDLITGDVFGTCKVNVDSNGAETVEPVLDSSRYYVLRIDDEKSGRHAFIGMGFHDREQSFEFKAAIQDHKRRIVQERDLKANPIQYRPTLNLAMKSGETIHVDIKNLSGPQISSKDNVIAADDDDDFGLMPPPPASKKVSSLSVKKQVQKTTPSLIQTPNLIDTKPKAVDPLLQFSAPAPVNPTPVIAPSQSTPSPFGNPSFMAPNPSIQPQGYQNFGAPQQQLGGFPVQGQNFGGFPQNNFPNQNFAQQNPNAQFAAKPQQQDPFAILSGNFGRN